jgi:hypothetical protein
MLPAAQMHAFLLWQGPIGFARVNADMASMGDPDTDY